MMWSSTTKFTPINVILQGYKSQVKTELKTMLNINTIDWGDQSAFLQRTAEYKHVLNNMTLQECAQVNATIVKRQLERESAGYTVHVAS